MFLTLAFMVLCLKVWFPRDSIYDVCIEDLQKVEPLMYTIGSIPGIAAAIKIIFLKPMCRL